jgi:perosamine synthetase
MNMEPVEQLPLFSNLEHQNAQRPDDFIPVYEPWLGERETANVLEVVRSTWISSLGRFIGQFEQEFAAYCGVKHGVSASNGTTALHLALCALGIGPGEEVIVPALTFVASANVVHYTGARPVFADVDEETWTIDPNSVEDAVTGHTRAIMAVHLYGHPAAMDDLADIARRRELWLIEDAAEAHGAAISGRRTGSLGQIAAFSFYANKIITTGEGGMVTTDDGDLAARCRILRDHGMSPENRYWHEEIGFNYRLTNLQAAVGVAQMERIDEFIRRKREIAAHYNRRLNGLPGVTLPYERPTYTNVYWMYSILVDDPYPVARDALIGALRQRGIDARPFFHPLDTLPPYRTGAPRPVSLALSRAGLNLPSSPRLRPDQIDRICDALWEIARQ